METIAYIGMDVHTTNYTLCGFTALEGVPFGRTQINPDMKELARYFKMLHERRGITHFICGYEAGCLGYSLYHSIKNHKWEGFSVECLIIAPSTIPVKLGRIKTDKQDAMLIGQTMLNGTCSYIYVPNQDDEAVKEYIRMRNDTQTQLKATKQQIIAMATRQGFRFPGKNYWTKKHLEWLRKLKFSNTLFQETMEEYLFTYTQQMERLERYDKRIAEIAETEKYCQLVKMLGCMKGIATHTAMSLIAEVGDFNRFPSAGSFTKFLGLVPGEHSSSSSRNQLGITKQGNSHLRRLLVESASCFNRGSKVKSKALKARQSGNTKEVIQYADRANARLHQKYRDIQLRSKANIAKVAVARELACFVWGMMTGHIE